MTGDEHRVELAGAPEEALAAVAEAAARWGGRWRREGRGGHLELPVTAGIRRGVLAGPLRAEASPGGCRLTFRVEESRYALQPGSVVILAVGAAAGITGILWPFFPVLLALAPLAAVLAFSAWFLVVSRLRTSGPGDFLDLVAACREEGGDGGGGPGV